MGDIVTETISPPAADRWDALLLGTVRSSTDGWPVDRIVLDDHPTLAPKVVDWIQAQALERFEVDEARLVHRVGAIPVGETIVVCASRGHPFRACREANRWMLEATKRHLPVWKREEGPEGQRWIEGQELELPDTLETARRGSRA